MNLTRNSFFSLLSIFLNTFFGFVYNKLVSIYFGPSGIGLLTHFQNLIASFTHIPQEGIHKAFINRLTQEEENDDQTGTFITHTVLWNIIIFILQWLGLMIYFYNANSPLEALFNGNGYTTLLIAVSFSLFTINLMASSWMVARQQLDKYALYTFLLGASVIIGMIVSYTMNLPLTLHWIVLSVSLGNFPVFIYMIFAVFIKFRYTRDDVRAFWKTSGQYTPLIVMAIVSLLSGKFLDIIVREITFERLGEYEVGIWQSAIKVPQAFVLFAGAYLSTIFYPNASSLLKDKAALHSFVMRFLLYYIPMTCLGLFLIFALRSYLLVVLYAQGFEEAEKYFYGIVIGDWLRCISWVGGYLMMASSDTRRFVLYELISGSVFLLVFLSGWDTYHWQVMSAANITRYAVYSMLVGYYYWKVWMPRNSRS